MQIGVETLDTYLTLLLQVLELRYIASLLLQSDRAVAVTSDAFISKSSKENFFF